jgi:hypothetical protein
MYLEAGCRYLHGNLSYPKCSWMKFCLTVYVLSEDSDDPTHWLDEERLTSDITMPTI